MCGIAGAFGVPNAAYIISLMLKQLQHRGQEAAGIVALGPDGRMRQIRGFGLVDEVFRKVDFCRDMPGTSAIGHVRYSTAAEPDNPKCIQPFMFLCRYGQMAVAHNGNLTNFDRLRSWMEGEGRIFQSASDTGIFPHLLAKSWAKTESRRVVSAVNWTEGATSLLVLTENGLHAAVDHLGFRPLCRALYLGSGNVGSAGSGQAAVETTASGALFASETCAFDLLRTEAVEAIPAGAVVSATAVGVVQEQYPIGSCTRQCSFEHIYFSRPDSCIFGQPVAAVRERLGVLLARRHPRQADIVIAVPDSSNMVAQAYARTLNLRFEFALIRNHYTGRTFITPHQPAREFGVKMKLNAVRYLVQGRSVVVVDDSIVRGTTCRKIARLLRDAGATQVHFLSASPPVIHPCHWGIDTGRSDELIAAKMPVEAMAAHLGLDSIGYLTTEDLLEALGDPKQEHHCVTCFNGILPG